MDADARFAKACSEAFDLRETPYARDAYQAIVDAWQRVLLERDYEREQRNRELIEIMACPAFHVGCDRGDH